MGPVQARPLLAAAPEYVCEMCEVNSYEIFSRGASNGNNSPLRSQSLCDCAVVVVIRSGPGPSVLYYFFAVVAVVGPCACFLQILEAGMISRLYKSYCCIVNSGNLAPTRSSSFASTSNFNSSVSSPTIVSQRDRTKHSPSCHMIVTNKAIMSS